MLYHSLGAIRNNHLTRLTTDSEFQKVAVKYIRNAPDRNGGRKARQERAKQIKAAKALKKKSAKASTSTSVSTLRIRRIADSEDESN